MHNPTVPSARQAAKSARMRQRLLDATLDCLIQLGYARTSTTAVLKRAGVSRGALLHHFPSKADLVLAAVEYVARLRLDEFRAAVAALPRGRERIPAAIDLVWQSFSSPSFYAMLELGVAARTDPELLASLKSAAERFDAELQAVVFELFADAAHDAALLDLGRRFLYYLMQGMALARVVEDDDAATAAVLELVKGLARTAQAD